MKRCFAYCSIFPRQQSLDRKELILLWMAEGFLQQLHGEKEMEVVGAECFDELLSRSLIEKDKVETKDKFRMHDLIYDLARLVSGKSSCNFEDGEIPGTVRHLAYVAEYHDISRRFEGLHKVNCLRTFQPRPSPLYPGEYKYYLGRTVSHMWLPKLRCLRILSLSRYKNISELPDSIDNLVLLRYLDLSYTSIKRLPDATFRLYNFQTLKLTNCEFLIQLSRKIENLVNLRHLDISDTGLEEMPAEICQLQDLRTLTSFIVGKQDGLRIMELRRFPYLQGKLSILDLQNVDDPMDACQANLKEKEKIEELMLGWGSDPQDSRFVKDVLDNLQPSTNLKKLNIKSYGGTTFPKWLGDSSYSNVTVLGISDCNYCLSLPPLGQLPSLKELVVKRMKMVNTIGHEFYCSNRGFPSFQPFPLLGSLDFEEMLEWEEWLPFKGEGSNFPFPCLQHLSLSKCPKLRGNLPSHLPSLTKVSISKCNQLEAKSVDLQWNSSVEQIYIKKGGKNLLPRMMLGANCLRELTLKKISSLISFPANSLPTSLQSLQIEHCENLEFLSHETWHKYTSLEYLNIWYSCHSLSFFPLDCFPALKFLSIINCPSLEAITIQGGGDAPNLSFFSVRRCEKLSSLPEQIILHALQNLNLHDLPQLVSFSPRCLPSSLKSLDVDVGVLSSMSKHELGLLFQRLTSLTHLNLVGCAEEDLVNTLLKKQLLPTSLKHLYLEDFTGLKLLEGKGLQHLTSLQALGIYNCGSLESLPEDQLPSSLLELIIYWSPLLEARYQGRKGKYWSKIAHIPTIIINREEVIIT